ncbi:pyrroloquinoline quinone biosynthesis protein PqqE [Roseibium aestuarii]|uniref:PqqA peptide cyclase n=1 Tax=Roseibium aestuarii TaxID=2600299 RepID=A0ABW4JW89_9HYPH|nr:pyrroloquinoline quinone biosynthesis protein PqqE [Roseibium aestuarii]
MTGPASRHRVTLLSCLRLAPQVLLRRDRTRGRWMVLAPEKVLWPDEISVDILRRCDGSATVAEVIEDLACDYAAPVEVIAPDVIEFLQDWCDRLLLRPRAGRSRNPGAADAARPAASSAAQRQVDPLPSSFAELDRRIGAPLGLLAELTHRCPLQCGYCSNPLELLKANRELPDAAWLDIFTQAAELGVVQAHLSGGEPTLRKDLEEIIAHLARLGVYSNLITAGVTLGGDRLERLADAGLNHVQISFQGAHAETTERVGRYPGAHAKKLAAAAQARDLGLPLTINAPIHRLNIDEVPDYVALALSLGADRLEIANVQYYGWAWLNRSALLPHRDDVLRQVDYVEKIRRDLTGVLAIDFVTPDYYADYPKPCMGGWGADAFALTPDGTMLPCHAAQTITSMRFENATRMPVRDIWERSEAFNRFRGLDWMPEPCRSCERKEQDFGGCRCQAFAMTGNAAATDPVCIKSPHHADLRQLPPRQEIRPRVIGAARELV